MGVILKNTVTYSEWETFDNIKRDINKIAKILYLYLVDGNYNQMDVTNIVFATDGYNYASIICQCYNFSGKNKGKFSEKKFGATVYLEDVLDFVKAYPNGIKDTPAVGSGIEMEEFLLKIIAERERVEESQEYNVNSNNNTNCGIGYSASNKDNTNFNIEDIVDKVKSFSKGGNLSEIIGVVVVVLIVFVLLFKFNLFGLGVKFAVLLTNILMYTWVIGMLILFIALLIDKVKISWIEGAGFKIKAIFFVAFGIASFMLLAWILELLMDFTGYTPDVLIEKTINI